MGRGLKTWMIVAFLFSSMGTPARAQTVQFLPEVDTHLKINPRFRAYVEVKDERDEGQSDQFTIGPSIQLYLKHLLEIKRITEFDLDDSKPKAVVLETGYRYITAPNSAPKNRMLNALTFHVPLKAGFLVSDRNRADLDWKQGKVSWRYRNKLTLERTFAVHSYHFIPYLAAEPYYTSQYSKWSTTDLYAGCLLPVGRKVQFNTYYEHENNTGKSPNKQQNFIGLALNLYFSLEKK